METETRDEKLERITRKARARWYAMDRAGKPAARVRVALIRLRVLTGATVYKPAVGYDRV